MKSLAGSFPPKIPLPTPPRQIEVVINPTPDQAAAGTVSHISWTHPMLIKAMEQAFVCRETEKIVRLEITDAGIKAVFG